MASAWSDSWGDSWGVSWGVAVVPPIPVAPPVTTSREALAESSGQRGGYLVPTQFGDDRAARDVLYPPGTGWTGALDDTVELERKKIRRRKVVALACIMMDGRR